MKRLLAIFVVFAFVSFPTLSDAYPTSDIWIQASDNATQNLPNEINEKLKNIFMGLSEEQIDNALKKDKNQLATKAKLTKRNDLEKLFDSQIATLKDRGTPKQIVNMFQNQKGKVLKKASEMAIGDGNIPFLPVIPRIFRSAHNLMAMVRNGGKVGYTDLNSTSISDVVDAPQELYYIYDVEDGSSTTGDSPENAENIIKLQKRSPLTAAEVIALTVHTDVLSRHHVWATGSRYGTAVLVPYVYLAGGVRPLLEWLYIDTESGLWGSPSCSSR